jgi:RNA polymerase sigma-70 factor (ECF subfamily)
MDLSKKEAQVLVTGCMNNERTAQEAMYKLFHADMLRVCYSYIPNRDLAKEAFNTGFLKVFQSIKSFDADKGELGGWIRKIMIFTSIDLCRKELKFSTLTTYDQDQ